MALKQLHCIRLAYATLLCLAIVLSLAPQAYALNPGNCAISAGTNNVVVRGQAEQNAFTPITFTNTGTADFVWYKLTLNDPHPWYSMNWLDNPQYTHIGSRVKTSNTLTMQSGSAGYTTAGGTKTLQLDMYQYPSNAAVDVPLTIEVSQNSDGSLPITCTGTIHFYAQTPQDPVPAAPVLSGSALPQQTQLNWTTPSGTVTGFTLKRNGTTVYTGTATSFTDAGLTNGTQYSYVVFATNATGNGANSNTVNLTPTAASTGGGEPQNITPRDIQIFSFGLAVFIGYKFIQQFKWRGND